METVEGGDCGGEYSGLSTHSATIEVEGSSSEAANRITATAAGWNATVLYPRRYREHSAESSGSSHATQAFPSVRTDSSSCGSRFAIYAGAVICFGGLIFAGIRMMSGRFQDAIPGLFGALFGAGVLGWGAGWIGSLTGQSM
jgi:hypothetical protein